MKSKSWSKRTIFCKKNVSRVTMKRDKIFVTFFIARIIKRVIVKRVNSIKNYI